MKNRKRLLLIAMITAATVSVFAGGSSEVQTEKKPDVPPASTSTTVVQHANTQQYDSESDFEVTKIDNGKSIEITKYVGKKQTVNIPSKIQGLPVNSIGNRAFISNKNITSVYIPKSVTEMGVNVFSGCTNLNSVTFQGTFYSRDEPNLFPGDLRTKFLAGGIGTYTRASGGTTWTKQ